MLVTPEDSSQLEHRLETLRFSPNPEAQMLVDQIPGITFNQTPRKIEMDASNTFALMKDPSLRLYLGILIRDLIAPKRFRKYRGKYISDYNLIFVCGGDRNPESRRVLSLHENMHGFINQVNPEFTGYRRRRFTEYLKQGNLNYPQFLKLWVEKLSEFSASLTPAEETRLTSYYAVEEGLAIWGATEANMKIKEVQNREALIEWHKATSIGSDSPDLKSMISGGNIERQGHSFVLYILEDLIKMGKSPGDAIKLVAQYPPDDMEIMRHHDKFAKELLAKEKA